MAAAGAAEWAAAGTGEWAAWSFAKLLPADASAGGNDRAGGGGLLGLLPNLAADVDEVVKRLVVKNNDRWAGEARRVTVVVMVNDMGGVTAGVFKAIAARVNEALRAAFPDLVPAARGFRYIGSYVSRFRTAHNTGGRSVTLSSTASGEVAAWLNASTEAKAWPRRMPPGARVAAGSQ